MLNKLSMLLLSLFLGLVLNAGAQEPGPDTAGVTQEPSSDTTEAQKSIKTSKIIFFFN
ncbi:MAG: hypothetical protein OXB86_04935 [Bdellovibrionales bacterium]|nr:hypothetical protein [Bdellovibrionales bacterium]